MFNCHVHHNGDRLNGGTGDHDHRSNSFFHFLVLKTHQSGTEPAHTHENENVKGNRNPRVPRPLVDVSRNGWRRTCFCRVFHRLFIILSGVFFLGWTKSPFSTSFPFCWLLSFVVVSVYDYIAPKDRGWWPPAAAAAASAQLRLET